MSTTPDSLARNGAHAIESYFGSRNVEAVTNGDGRYTVYVPGGDQTEDLQVSLASTPASRGILARVKGRRAIPAPGIPRALVIANQWNRSAPLPHAVVVTRNVADQPVGSVFLEAQLPPVGDGDTEVVRRFIDAVIAGSRQFWSSATVQELTRPAGAGIGANRETA